MKTNTPDTKLLSVNNLTVSFKRGREWSRVVNGVSFEIAKGESFALVGESGSGKSVTALSIVRLLPFNGIIEHGSVIYQGTEILDLPERSMNQLRGQGIGMVFQDPMSSLNPVMTAGQQISEILAMHQNFSGANRKKRVLELFDQVRLPRPLQHYDQYPHQLSGGMRQRVMIAMALAGKPELLIADEPTTALDVTIQAQILELLKQLQKELGMALLLITHDFGVVAELCERIAVMKDGHIVEQSGREFFSGPQNAYSRALLAAMPMMSAKAPGQKSTGAIHIPSPKEHPSGPPLLEVHHYKIHFPVKKGLFSRPVEFVKAVDDVSFQLNRSEILALVGESGSGKTTLGKGVINLIQSTAGRVIFNGTEISANQRKRSSSCMADMQIIFQDPYSSMNPRLMVQDIIDEGYRVRHPHQPVQERHRRVAELLEMVGLPASARFRYPHEFSGGQRQRISIARAMAVEPQLIICDEPTSALDLRVQAQILALLGELREKCGLSYLFITHDIAIVAEFADRVAVMHSGKIIETGPARDVLNNPEHPQTQQLVNAVPRLRRGEMPVLL